MVVAGAAVVVVVVVVVVKIRKTRLYVMILVNQHSLQEQKVITI
jgi:hypothetical protein